MNYLKIFRSFICCFNILFLIIPQNLLLAKSYTLIHEEGKSKFFISVVDSNNDRVPEAVSIIGKRYKEHFSDQDRDGFLNVWELESKNYSAKFTRPFRGRFKELELIHSGSKNKKEDRLERQPLRREVWLAFAKKLLAR